MSDDDRNLPEAGSRAGSAYLVVPDDGPGPGVLVLHSWWGLNGGVKEFCNRLADEGFTVLAPDLLGGGLPETSAEAEVELAESDPNETAGLVLSSIVALRAHSVDSTAPVAVIGFSMGASWALWVATRQPDSVEAVVAYYGTQNIDFEALRARLLGHYAERDPLVTEDELVEMKSHLLLLDKDVEFHTYPGTGHWFAESGRPELYEEAAAEQAWERTVAFLRDGAGATA